MRRSAKRFSTRVLAVVLAVCTVNVGLATAAFANSSKANTDTFSVTSTYAFPNNYVCIKYTQTSTITYKAVRYGPTGVDHMVDYRINSIKVSKIKATYKMVSYDSVDHACTTRGVKWKRMEVAQHWRAYSCTYNPQIQGSIPWGIGVGVWPSCGNRTQAKWKSTYDKANGLAGPTQTQSTTGTIKYANHQIAVQPSSKAVPKSGGCYGSYVSMHWYLSGNDVAHNFPVKKLCLTPKW
jgi:hypothetical protein